MRATTLTLIMKMCSQDKVWKGRTTKCTENKERRAYTDVELSRYEGASWWDVFDLLLACVAMETMHVIRHSTHR